MTRATVLDDATVEEILHGARIPASRATPSDWDTLAEVVETIRRSADEPVAPTAELARRIVAGDFSGVTPTRPARRYAVGRLLGTRVAGMSVRGRLSAVLALAFTGFSGVAVAGALPDAAQQRVESVIESVTPISFSDQAEFGQDVADDARDGGVDGREVSEDAHELGHRPDEPGEQGHEPVLPDLPTPVPTTPGEHRPDDPGAPEDRPGADPTRNPGQPPVEPGQPPVDLDDRRPTGLPEPPAEARRP